MGPRLQDRPGVVMNDFPRVLFGHFDSPGNLGQSIPQRRQSTDPLHLPRRQMRIRMVPLKQSVAHVVAMSPDVQVPGIHALTSATPMQHILGRRHRRDEEVIQHAVGILHKTTKPDACVTIPTDTAPPPPTSVQRQVADLRDDSLLGRRQAAHGPSQLKERHGRHSSRGQHQVQGEDS